MSKPRRRLRGQPSRASSPCSIALAEPGSSGESAKPCSFNRRRRWWLRLLLLTLAPLLALALLEVALRVCGYGYATSFFVRTPGGAELVPNRNFGWQFMPRATATQPYPLLLSAHKGAGVLRIFVLGESAAQGTPAPAFGFSRILEVLLESQFPRQRFEIVNVAMRGINSHAIRRVARECKALAPDLFIVYMGNNESVGLHMPDPDVFTLSSYPRAIRMLQWIKTTRIGQLGDDLLQRRARKPDSALVQDMAYFRKKRLRANDPRREAIYANFRMNLEEICQAARDAGPRMVLATVAVNLKDCPPLASLHRADFTPVELERWEACVARGRSSEAQGSYDEAASQYLAAKSIDGHYAELHFRLARCYLALGRTNQAADHYSLARDWDALQFRTDSRINRVIREVGAKRSAAGVTLVDVEAAFARAAANSGGVPGSEFFHEHVHLTFDGDYLLARTLLPAVTAALGLESPSPNAQATPGKLASRQEAAEALAFTAWDELDVFAAMTRFTAKPPFLDQLEHGERQARAEMTFTNRAALFSIADYQRSAGGYQAATRRRPNDWQIHFNFGNLLNNFGNRAEAAAAHQRAVTLMPYFLPLYIALGQELWMLGRRNDAIAQFSRALELDPDYLPAKNALAQARRGR